MDKHPLISSLNRLAPDAILETRPFGRSEVLSVWIEADAILKIASVLVSHSEFLLNWLENLSVVELEGSLVLTYFLRSTLNSNQLIVRYSLVPSSPKKEVVTPSVQKFWPMAAPMEVEASEMFGVRFGPKHGPQIERKWDGFPLRKKYQMPGFRND